MRRCAGTDAAAARRVLGTVAYGIDAHYYGATGEQHAGHRVTRLHEAGLDASIRVAGLNDGATLRLGPFDHEAAWLALGAFLGRPMGMPA